jgi:hypothetical protein
MKQYQYPHTREDNTIWRWTEHTSKGKSKYIKVHKHNTRDSKSKTIVKSGFLHITDVTTTMALCMENNMRTPRPLQHKKPKRELSNYIGWTSGGVKKNFTEF